MPALQAKSLIASHSLMSQEILTFQRNREQRKILKLNFFSQPNSKATYLGVAMVIFMRNCYSSNLQFYNES